MKIDVKSTKLSPWVVLKTKSISTAGDSSAKIYHSFSQFDYVSLLAVRRDGFIPLVKQYRPAVEKVTIELPGGLVDRGCSASSIARAELYEETGHKTIGDVEFLGCLSPDTGRLENQFWAYFAEALSNDDNWEPEPGIKVVLLSGKELRKMICDGSFNHALHIALISLAITKGFFSW